MSAQQFLQYSRNHTMNAVRMYGLTPLQMAAQEVNEELDDELRAAAKQNNAACSMGCDHCCHRPIPVSNMEAALIAAEVSEWEQSAQDALMTRLNEYEEVTRPQRANPPVMMRVPCPFLVNHECSIYLSRPLCCRGQSSDSVAACAKWRENPKFGETMPVIDAVNNLALATGQGQMEGAQQGGGKPAMLELGLATKFLLENQDLINVVARDAGAAQDVFWSLGMRPLPGEPEGTRPMNPTIGKMVEGVLFWKQGVQEWMPRQGMSAHEALLMLQTPIGYESEDQLLESRDWYTRALDKFCELELDPAEVFDALGRFQAQTLTSQGFCDKDLNRKLGDTLHGYSSQVFPELTETLKPRKKSGKLKVGFVGSSLYNHQGGRWSLGYLMKPREEVEITSIMLGPESDKYTEAFRERSDHFYQLLGSVPECARFIKSLGLDAIVWLGAHSSARAKQFVTFRLAPLQVTTWGTPFSPGFPTVTHYLASDCMEPDNGSEHYSEQLIQLPGFHLCYERAHIPTPQSVDVSKLGPGPHALIAQIPAKLLPRQDAMFRRVAEELGTPLLIVDYEDHATAVVRKRLETAHVPVKWLKQMPGPEFLGLARDVAMTLDTPDWNGGNTTLEAWLQGTPVISMPGTLMRGRHTLGFLRVMGQEDLCAKTEDEYVAMAKNHEEMRERTKALPIEQLFENHSATDRFFAALRKLAGWD